LSISFGSAVKVRRIAPITAAAANKVARKSSPLPRKTVAKKRSSRVPRRSRSTPMNQRNEIPATGIKFNASATRPRSAVSQAPASNGSAGMTDRSIQKIAINRIEKTMPATAAALGVLSWALVMIASRGMGPIADARARVWLDAPSCGPFRCGPG
jgi:hypothetical protein